MIPPLIKLKPSNRAGALEWRIYIYILGYRERKASA